MHDRPTVLEILEAVRGWLETEVSPQAADARLKFQTLIAANMLAQVARGLSRDPGDAAEEARGVERLIGRGGGGVEPAADLCEQIRAGRFDEPGRRAELVRFLRQSVARKLAVANPRLLPRDPQPISTESPIAGGATSVKPTD